MYVFVGGSISSRNRKEAEQIAARINSLCGILDKLGHSYDAELLTSVDIHAEAKEVDFEIPEKYLAGVSDAVIGSVQGLRVKNPPYSLRDEIACYNWSLDLIDKAGCGIWDLTKSSSGSGFEIALALQRRLPCLVLFDRPTISTMINGSTSRLLMVARWDDHLQETVTRFLEKAQMAYDQVVRFNVTQDMGQWIKSRSSKAGFNTISEYLRYLVERDKKESEV